MEIDTDGVVEDKREEAEKELRDFFEEFLGRNKNIKIIVTRDFKTVVNDILREKLSVKIPYDPTVAKAKALMKTIEYVAENALNIVLVIDAGIFGEWTLEQSAQRLLNLTHEGIHMKDALLAFKVLGAELFKEPNTPDELLLFLSNDLWNEYHAERVTNEILGDLIKKGRVIVNSPPTLSYLESLEEALVDIIPFCKKQINEFRIGKISIDALWEASYLRIREMLVLATFVLAATDALNQFKKETEKIRKLRQHDYLLGEQWDAICDHFRSAYGEKCKFPENQLKAIMPILRKIFYNCGFELEERDHHLYVGVHTINFS